MALKKRGGIWYFRKQINGRLYRESTGFADKKAAERCATEIELDIRAGIHGWKNTIPSFAEWWVVYRETYTPLKSARNRDAQIVAHFLPHFGAKRLDEITKSDIVRYLNFRRSQMTGNPGHKKPRRISGEHRTPRARSAPVDLRARHRGGARYPQSVPRHQAWEGQAAHARTDLGRGIDPAGDATPALPTLRPVRTRHGLSPRRDPRHRFEARY
jgi:hypothetical protein